MTVVRKFLFDRSFDDEKEVQEEVEEEVEKEAEPEVIVPTFSEEEMKAAREEGFTAGKEKGINEAAAATERDILGSLSTLEGKFQELFKAKEEADSSILETAISIAVTIARKVFPSLNEQIAQEEIERMVVQSLEKILEEPRVTIYVNAGLTDPLTERLGALVDKAGYKGEVEVQAADDMSVGDCRVEWSGGGAARNMDELWQEIDEVVERNLSGIQQASEAAPPGPQPDPPSPDPEPSPEAAPETAPEPPSETPCGPAAEGQGEAAAGGVDPGDGTADDTAGVDPVPEKAILDSDQDETAEPPADAGSGEPLPKAPEEAGDQQPEPPEDAPDTSGAEDTTTDPEDT